MDGSTIARALLLMSLIAIATPIATETPPLPTAHAQARHDGGRGDRGVVAALTDTVPAAVTVLLCTLLTAEVWIVLVVTAPPSATAPDAPAEAPRSRRLRRPRCPRSSASCVVLTVTAPVVGGDRGRRDVAVTVSLTLLAEIETRTARRRGRTRAPPRRRRHGDGGADDRRGVARGHLHVGRRPDGRADDMGVDGRRRWCSWRRSPRPRPPPTPPREPTATRDRCGDRRRGDRGGLRRRSRSRRRRSQ